MRRHSKPTALFLILAVLQTGVFCTALAGEKNPDVTWTEDNPDTAIPERKNTNPLADRVQAGLGFLEKSDADLLKVFEKAWHASASGESDTESVVLIFLMSDGTYTGRLVPPTHEYKKVTFQWNPSTIAIVHTHPNRVAPAPSELDEDVAHHFAVPIFTITRKGMYVYNPVTRKSRRLMGGLDWLDPARWTHEVFVSAAFGTEK